MNADNKLRVITLKTLEEAIVYATQLLRESRWFVCTPLPDDMYEFQTKKE